MKVTYNWLQQYINLTHSPDQVAHELTMLGLEVELVERLPWNFKDVVIGRVTSLRELPGNGHLRICSVDLGKEEVEVVCGAPNVAKNQLVAVAPEGARLPGGMAIGRKDFGDFQSCGMICSEEELGLSDRGDGVLVLDDNAAPGDDLIKWLGPEDYAFELSITPNRPDCLSVIGVARDLAAKLRVELNLPEVSFKEEEKLTSEVIKVDLEDSEHCPRYSARYLADIVVGPSPWWLVHRLQSVGVRSINNVVDVTNYVMMETGQPLHAFDYDLLEGGEIVVRQADVGETFVTLDQKEHRLQNDTLLICNGMRPVAIAGVMGGLNSEVSDSTKRVLLESAYFEPHSVRRTSKALGISTESSQRFERGTDPNGVLFASNRASQLMEDLCCAKIGKDVVDVYPKDIKPKSIRLRPARARYVLGAEVPEQDCKQILTHLGANVSDGKHWTVTVPTFRPDLEREIDLIEEIARVWDYDNIQPRTKFAVDTSQPQRIHNVFEQNARSALLGLGYCEVVTLSLMGRRQITPFLEDGCEAVALKNPLSEDFSVLRPSCLPGLLQVCSHNKNRGASNLRIYEIGRCFSCKITTDAVDRREWKSLAGLSVGTAAPDSWQGNPGSFSLFHLKGHLQNLGIMCRLPEILFEEMGWPVCEGNALRVIAGEQEVGWCGKLSNDTLKLYDLEKEDVFVFEIDLSTAERFEKGRIRYKPVSRFPAAPRDLSLVVDQNVKTGEMLDAIRRYGGKYLHNVELVDLFAGEQIPSGKKSLTFSLLFLDESRTLRDEEVEMAVSNITAGLEKQLGAKLRAG